MHQSVIVMVLLSNCIVLMIQAWLPYITIYEGVVGTMHVHLVFRNLLSKAVVINLCTSTSMSCTMVKSQLSVGHERQHGGAPVRIASSPD